MSDRVAVVTGASSGIGRATALRLAKSGWNLVLCARREALLLDVASQCLVAGSRVVVPVPCNVARPSDVARLVEAVTPLVLGAERAILVNAAGSWALGPFEEMDIETAVDQIEVGLAGLMRVTHGILPLLRQARHQHVIQILSVAATHTFAGAAAYCAAKAGALAFSRALAQEVRGSGVRVTSVLPGATSTALWDASDWKPDEGDMLSARAVAQTICEIVDTPDDRSVDEISIMPLKGIL